MQLLAIEWPAKKTILDSRVHVMNQKKVTELGVVCLGDSMSTEAQIVRKHWPWNRLVPAGRLSLPTPMRPRV